MAHGSWLPKEAKHSHGDVDELDKVPDETHDDETDGDGLAELGVLCGSVSELLDNDHSGVGAVAHDDPNRPSRNDTAIPRYRDSAPGLLAPVLSLTRPTRPTRPTPSIVPSRPNSLSFLKPALPDRRRLCGRPPLMRAVLRGHSKPFAYPAPTPVRPTLAERPPNDRPTVS